MAHAQRLADGKGMLEVRRSEEGLELELTGEWRALRLPAIEAALAQLDLKGVRRVEISTERLAELDLSGAWCLHRFIYQAHCDGTESHLQGRTSRSVTPGRQDVAGRQPAVLATTSQGPAASD